MDPFEGVLSDPLSLNKYTYAHNSPVDRADPSGYFSGTLIEVAAVQQVKDRVQWAVHDLFWTTAGQHALASGVITDTTLFDPAIPDADFAWWFAASTSFVDEVVTRPLTLAKGLSNFAVEMTKGLLSLAGTIGYEVLATTYDVGQAAYYSVTGDLNGFQATSGIGRLAEQGNSTTEIFAAGAAAAGEFAVAAVTETVMLPVEFVDALSSGDDQRIANALGGVLLAVAGTGPTLQAAKSGIKAVKSAGTAAKTAMQQLGAASKTLGSKGVAALREAAELTKHVVAGGAKLTGEALRQANMARERLFAALGRAVASIRDNVGKPRVPETGGSSLGRGVFDDAGAVARAVGDEADGGVRYRIGEEVVPLEKTYEMALNPQLYIEAVVERYGINLRGSGQRVEVVFNPRLASAGKSRQATPNVIEIGPSAFANEQELANTIAHELNHARSWLKGGTAPEEAAYSAGDALADLYRRKQMTGWTDDLLDELDEFVRTALSGTNIRFPVELSCVLHL